MKTYEAILFFIPLMAISFFIGSLVSRYMCPIMETSPVRTIFEERECNKCPTLADCPVCLPTYEPCPISPDPFEDSMFIELENCKDTLIKQEELIKVQQAVIEIQNKLKGLE